MSDALLLIHSTKSSNSGPFPSMPRYSQVLGSDETYSIQTQGKNAGSNFQLPSLNSILNKIQSEQQQPLPLPTTGALQPTVLLSSHGNSSQRSILSTPHMMLPNPVREAHPYPQYINNIHNMLAVPLASQPQQQMIQSPITTPPPRLSTGSGDLVSPQFIPRVNKKPTKFPSPSRKYKCKTCEKTFTTSGHLARHTRIHTGVKNHLCPQEGCDARFSRQDNCMQHYKTHLNGKKGRKRGKSL